MIEAAIKLSMAEEGAQQEKPAAEQPAEQQQEGTNLENIVSTEFMKGLVDDLGLDISENQIDNVMKEAGIGAGEEKKEEEKKEEDKKEEEKKDDKPGDGK